MAAWTRFLAASRVRIALHHGPGLPAGRPGGVLSAGLGEPYGPGLAALLLGAWAVAALVAGILALDRRDS
jgi:hypothetical protein